MPAKNKRRGNCYVTVEALYHLLGGKAAGLVPHWVKHEGDTHWYLVKREWVPLQPNIWSAGTMIKNDTIIDPTAKQFKHPPPYYKGRGSGFLTKKPSRRAQDLMEKMLWQNK